MHRARADDTFRGKFLALKDGTFDAGNFIRDPESGWIDHPLSRYLLDKE